jgi:hypothetical protein
LSSWYPDESGDHALNRFLSNSAISLLGHILAFTACGGWFPPQPKSNVARPSVTRMLNHSPMDVCKGS